MNLRSRAGQGLLISLVCLTACGRPVNCDDCSEHLKTAWSYKLRQPFGMTLSEGEVITQDNVKGEIVVLDSETGSVNVRLAATTRDKDHGALVGWFADKRFIVYEQVVDDDKSHLKIYDRLTRMVSDSVPISLKEDLSSSRGVVKLDNPVVDDSAVFFVLHDGTLNAYNLSTKTSWCYNLKSLPLPYPVVVTKLYVHVQLPSYFGGGFYVITIAKNSGKLAWKKHFSGQTQLSQADNKLLMIDGGGNLLHIDPATGNFTKHALVDEPVSYYRLLGDNKVALATTDKWFFVNDLIGNKTILKYKLCAELADVTYSRKMNVVFLADKGQHCFQVDLSSGNMKCIQQFIDYTEGNTVVSGDSLFINKQGELRLLQLKH